LIRSNLEPHRTLSASQSAVSDPTNTSDDLLSNLPMELFVEVFSHLHIQEIADAMAVCKVCVRICSVAKFALMSHLDRAGTRELAIKCSGSNDSKPIFILLRCRTLGGIKVIVFPFSFISVASQTVAFRGWYETYGHKHALEMNWMHNVSVDAVLALRQSPTIVRYDPHQTAYFYFTRSFLVLYLPLAISDRNSYLGFMASRDQRRWSSSPTMRATSLFTIWTLTRKCEPSKGIRTESITVLHFALLILVLVEE